MFGNCFHMETIYFHFSKTLMFSLLWGNLWDISITFLYWCVSTIYATQCFACSILRAWFVNKMLLLNSANHTLPSKTVGVFFLKEIETFIQQGWVKWIKSDSKNIWKNPPKNVNHSFNFDNPNLELQISLGEQKRPQTTIHFLTVLHVYVCVY